MCTATETNFTFLPSRRQDERRGERKRGKWCKIGVLQRELRKYGSFVRVSQQLERELQVHIARRRSWRGSDNQCSEGSQCARRTRRRIREKGKRRACGSLRLCTAHATPLPWKSPFCPPFTVIYRASPCLQPSHPQVKWVPKTVGHTTTQRCTMACTFDITQIISIGVCYYSELRSAITI